MSENKTPEQQAQVTPAPAAETPKPKLADGLFTGFTLGSILTQGPTGNSMSNLKKPMMDYEKTYEGATKNQSLTEEELKALAGESVKKAESNFDKLKNKLADKKNPPKDPAAVAAKIGREELGQAEMTRRAEEGKKSDK